MANLNISLTPELLELVNAQVASGKYHSASEVVHEGLRLLLEQEDMHQLRLEELRREIQKGTESLERGEARVFHSGEELAAHIEAEGRRLMAERQKSR